MKLEQLASTDVADKVRLCGTVDSAFEVLSRMSEVKDVPEALARGLLTEQNVENFVAKILAEFEPGRRLPAEHALAALAVALAPCRLEFAEVYLKKLAALDLMEVQFASLVARYAERKRSTIFTKTTLEVVISSIVNLRNPEQEKPFRLPIGNTSQITSFERVA